jgi:hypothetical protein
MYWLTTKRQKSEVEWLSTLRRLVTNALAFAHAKRDGDGCPDVEDAAEIVGQLADYMSNEFDDCPWLLVRETSPYVNNKYHVVGKHLASEESQFIVFMWILLSHLDKGKGGAYFLSQEFAREIFTDSIIEMEAHEAIIRWMRGDDEIILSPPASAGGDKMDVSDAESDDSKEKGEA